MLQIKEEPIDVGGEVNGDLLEEENSRWVTKNMQRLNRIIEVSIEGLEDRTKELFCEIERR